MPKLRFNHMELTVPIGELDKLREPIRTFYGDVFDMEAIDVPILGQTGLLLRSDPETSQFILITEQKKHLQSPGFDHLGFLLESREDVDGLREKIGKWQEQDSRVEIKDYEDLVIQNVTTRAFYVKYLLPIWFDVQVIEYAEGTAPERAWHFQ
ncbi:MAG: hypothetical protein NZ808_03620 [Myxococcota bacterium]|jgi:hypothetical protein|nr:hypothetical protein [Myxococcota bacterium]HIG72124.1 hypothetical protein [Myxococcales bacterium]HIM03463.1 hypothetical protein [Myxococcales bacterium]